MWWRTDGSSTTWSRKTLISVDASAVPRSPVRSQASRATPQSPSRPSAVRLRTHAHLRAPEAPSRPSTPQRVTTCGPHPARRIVFSTATITTRSNASRSWHLGTDIGVLQYGRPEAGLLSAIGILWYTVEPGRGERGFPAGAGNWTTTAVPTATFQAERIRLALASCRPTQPVRGLVDRLPEMGAHHNARRWIVSRAHQPLPKTLFYKPGLSGESVHTCTVFRHY